ncbi:MAG: sulfotransferase [Acidimicrobiales bacterium]
MTVEPAAKPAGTRPPNPLRDPKRPRDWAKLYGSSLLSARQNPSFADLETFCLFIGYSRSGATLVGSMLNAHPEVLIAHELDAVNLVRHRFTRSQLFSLLLRRDRTFGSMGRFWSGYSYEVPGQYQGIYKRLRVLGDKRARSTALLIARRPDLLDRIRRTVKVPLRVVHITRNPFDNIVTESRRHKLSLGQGTAWYEQSCDAVAKVRSMLDPAELVDIHYETFAASPADSLAELCRFIGVEPDPAYLAACAGLVWSSTNRTRDTVEWSPEERAGVERLIDRFELLSPYSFDD